MRGPEGEMSARLWRGWRDRASLELAVIMGNPIRGRGENRSNEMWNIALTWNAFHSRKGARQKGK